MRPARQSLKDVLIRKTLGESLILWAIVSVSVCAVLSYTLISTVSKQRALWVDSFPKSILPHLIDSDYFSIKSKGGLLDSTGLFRSFWVEDNLGNRIVQIPRSGDEPKNQQTISIKDESGVIWGTFSYAPNLFAEFAPLSFALVFLVAMLVAIYLVSRRRMDSVISTEFLKFGAFLDRVKEITERLRAGTIDGSALNGGEGLLSEEKTIERVIQKLAEEIRSSHERLREFTREMEKRRFDENISRVALQVAHDIRSPLSAISVAMGQTRSIPEDMAALLKGAVNRIQDIANDLLDTFRREQVFSEDHNALVQTTVDSVIREKRLRFDKSAGVNIRSERHSSPSQFCKLSHAQLGRVLSNLADNAVEACTQNGQVVIAWRVEGEYIEFNLSDNGKGIPAEVLSSLGRGRSFGKEHGTGLGVYHSRESIERAGGQFEIFSRLNEGTRVRFTLPVGAAPAWFTKQIEFSRDTRLVVVDDDSTIHDLWKARFENTLGSITHLYSPSSLLEWHGNQSPDILKSALFLVDYEFFGSTTTGIDLIRQLSLEKHSILVTGRDHDGTILRTCLDSNIKLLPKSLCDWVPLVSKDDT